MDPNPQPLLSHLIELRRRLLICVICFILTACACYTVAEPVFQFLAQPLVDVLAARGPHRMIFTNLTEAFLTYVRVAAFAGFFLSFPLIATQAWLFIAPGLFRHERQIFIALLIATPLLFLLGAAFAYYWVFPTAYTFFLSFEVPGATGILPIVLEAKVNEYLSFVMRLILAFGICFELPVFMTVMARAGLVSCQGLLRKWRYAVVGIFALAALITPPDIFSMISLALPLILLYGASMVLVRFIEKSA